MEKKTMADKIKESELFIYDRLGHAAYEEAKDFNRRVLDYFCMSRIQKL